MSITPFQVTLWIELLAAGLGGLQGALFAAGFKSRRIDVLGVIAIGLAVSLGGSLLRDLVLNQPPVVVWSNWYLIVAGAAAILGMALQPVLARADWLITVLLDAIVMGLFGAIGASKALSLGVGVAGAVLVGVIGAIGGGMLRDVMLGLSFSFLHVGTLYAVAAGAGTGVLVLLAELGTPIPIAGVVCLVVTTLVRLAAVRFEWTFPEQFVVRARRRPSGGTR
ncbi:trimeric intracellular cation channel family protein [Kribbella sp. CA-253562]|uniref:trimeric intracellular cation channel family protein n=1 Tax=Kribbella sp. CA-253562 TaxID=3239942 RepID=UPI003D93BBD1